MCLYRYQKFDIDWEYYIEIQGWAHRKASGFVELFFDSLISFTNFRIAIENSSHSGLYINVGGRSGTLGESGVSYFTKLLLQFANSFLVSLIPKFAFYILLLLSGLAGFCFLDADLAKFDELFDDTLLALVLFADVCRTNTTAHINNHRKSSICRYFLISHTLLFGTLRVSTHSQLSGISIYDFASYTLVRR